MRINTAGSQKKRLILAVLLLTFIVLLKLATFYPTWIEHNYSTGIYPQISSVYRLIYGRFGISVGDLLYLIAGVLLVFGVVRSIKILSRWKVRGQNFKRRTLKLVLIVATIYIVFDVSWGLNYNRLGIAYQLELDTRANTIEDLKTVTALLLNRVNRDRLALGESSHLYPPYNEVFATAKGAYESATLRYPFIKYNIPSVKRSMYGRMGNFLGFLGYFNPFTGEAQVNLTQPKFLIPFITCHEMAHQLGYANESEANFVGYLAATSSNDKMFKYSTYFDLFNYANRELYASDSITAKANYNKLDTLVKVDIAELRAYLKKSENVVEPFIRIFYDQYLKANQQDKGVKSYNEVVNWLIAYYKKYHHL